MFITHMKFMTQGFLYVFRTKKKNLKNSLASAPSDVRLASCEALSLTHYPVGSEFFLSFKEAKNIEAYI